MNKVLNNIYHSKLSPGYLAGITTVYRLAKKKHKSITLSEVKNYLNKQYVYTLHKPVRKHFPRNKIFTVGLDADWQADLVDMIKYKNENKGFQYILTVTDVLSKYSWAIPIKTKKNEHVEEAFKEILSSGRKPWRLLTDSGTEFTGKLFQDFLSAQDIFYMKANTPDIKASISERYNRTLKTRLWKHFTKTSSHKYLDILQPIVTAINNTPNRTTGFAPASVNFSNEKDVWNVLYGKEKKLKPKFVYKVGKQVRISREKHLLEKGYLHNFSSEIFVIKKQLPRDPPVYKLQDLNGEDITGVFYHTELVPAVRRKV